MVVKPQPGRDTRRDEQEALEEIRRLFARYRRLARHGQVIERDEPAKARRDEAERPTALRAR